jgi:hypothetical protein
LPSTDRETPWESVAKIMTVLEAEAGGLVNGLSIAASD